MASGRLRVASGTALNGLSKSTYTAGITVPSPTTTTTAVPTALTVKPVPGATVAITGEPFAGSGPYVLLTSAAGLFLIGIGLVRRRGAQHRE